MHASLRKYMHVSLFASVFSVEQEALKRTFTQHSVMAPQPMYLPQMRSHT